MILTATEVQPAHIEIIDGAHYLAAVADAISNARHSIIASHYMVRAERSNDAELYRHLWRALAAAPARLSQCRILLNSGFYGFRDADYNAAAANRLAAYGWKVRHHPKRITAHQKLWIIDNELIFLGSSNIGHNERHTTTNINIRCTSREHALHILIDYNRQWATATP